MDVGSGVDICCETGSHRSHTCQGRNLALAFAAEATRLLDDIVRAGDLVAAHIRESRGRFDLYAWSREAALPWGTIQATFIGPDGKVMSSTIEPYAEPTDLSDREHFRIHLDGKIEGLFIGKLVMGRVWRQPLIPVTRRVEAQDGSFPGRPGLSG